MKLFYTDTPPSRIGELIPFNEIMDGEIFRREDDKYPQWQRVGNNLHCIRTWDGGDRIRVYENEFDKRPFKEKFLIIG
jgi:hypothetical protein